MSYKQSLSAREKILGILAASLLITLALFGYAKGWLGLTASVLAQDQPAIEAKPTPIATPTETKPVSDDDRKNQERQITDQLNNAKNWKREIEDIKRETKGTVNATVAEGYVTQYEQCWTARQAEIGTSDFWNNTQQCNDFSRSIEDELRDNLRPARTCVQTRRNIDDRKKEKKNLDRNVKDILRNDKNADVSQLTNIISQIDALFAKADALTAVCNQDLADQLDTIQSDLNPLFQDFYSYQQEINEKANQSRMATENKREFDSNIKRQCEKEFTRELKNVEKEYTKLQKSGTVPAGAGEAFENAKTVYNNLCVTLLQTMQNALTSGDTDAFNDARNEFNNSNRDFWDSLQAAREIFNQQQQLKDILREITNKEKELVKMKKEYERGVKKAGQDVPEVKQLLTDYEALIQKAKEAAQSDPEVFRQDYQQELNDLQNEFWSSQQKVHELGDIKRWTKDIEKEVQFRERDLKNMAKNKEMDQGIIEELKGILSEMKSVVAQARQLAGKDPEAARDLMQSIDDLRMKWDETTRSIHEKNQIMFQLGEVQREISHAENAIRELLKDNKISEDEANNCFDFINEVKSKAEEFKGKPVSEDMKEYFDGLEQQAFKVCPALQSIKEAPGPDRAYYENFVKQNVVGVDQDIAQQILQKVSEEIVNKVVQRLLSDPATVQNLMQKAGDKYKDAATGTLEAASNFYDDAAQKALLEKKAEILDLTNRLAEMQTKVKLAQDKLIELQGLQNDISAYNFYGSAGDQLENEIQAFIARAGTQGLSNEEIRSSIANLKAKKEAAIQASKQAKLKDKIIPFMDTDDNSWYTKYVAPLARLGVVRGKGDGKNFDPAASVTVAELLTMAFRISGNPEPSGNAALCGGKLASHWANKFVKWAEGKDLSIVRACTDVNRPALRWEVAQVLLETATGSVAESREVCFKDVKTADQPVNSIVCAARDAGVMKGTNGLANAYNKVIRAEAATMVKQAAEKLFGVNFGGNGGGQGGPKPAPIKQPTELKRDSAEGEDWDAEGEETEEGEEELYY